MYAAPVVNQMTLYGRFVVHCFFKIWLERSFQGAVNKEKRLGSHLRVHWSSVHHLRGSWRRGWDLALQLVIFFLYPWECQIYYNLLRQHKFGVFRLSYQIKSSWMIRLCQSRSLSLFQLEGRSSFPIFVPGPHIGNEAIDMTDGTGHQAAIPKGLATLFQH